MKKYFVYILKCADHSYYTGITSELEKRMEQHQEGRTYDGYTNTRRPVSLVWFQEFVDPTEAINKEKQIKGWSRKKKEALIKNDFKSIQKLSKNYTENGSPS